MSAPFQTITEDLSQFKLPHIEWTDTPVLLLYGSAGAGKTVIAMSYAVAWGTDAFVSAPGFCEHLRDNCNNKGDAGKHLSKLYNTPRLVIDDLAYETPEVIDIYGTKYHPHRIFRKAVYHRINAGLRTIITANIGIDKLGLIYDESDTNRGRIHSRLTGGATVYHFQGDRRKNEMVNVRLMSTAAAKAKVTLNPEPDTPPELPMPTKKEIVESLEAVYGKPGLEETVRKVYRQIPEYLPVLKEFDARKKAEEKAKAEAEAKKADKSKPKKRGAKT